MFFCTDLHLKFMDHSPRVISGDIEFFDVIFPLESWIFEKFDSALCGRPLTRGNSQRHRRICSLLFVHTFGILY